MISVEIRRLILTFTGTGTESDPYVGDDNAGGILAAMRSVPSNQEVTVIVSSGYTRISTTIKLRPNTHVKGAGMNATVLVNKPYVHLNQFGVLDTNCTLRNLTADGNRFTPSRNQSKFDGTGIAIVGVSASISSVLVKNMVCGGVLPRQGAMYFHLTDSIVVDSQFGLWAEATCGYAGHLIARNRFVTIVPGAQDAIDYDNGNTDGILNCTPPSATERPKMLNVIADNVIVNSRVLAIAIARMGGFVIKNNFISNPGPAMRNCQYYGCNPIWGNSIHLEHESFDVEVTDNVVVQGCRQNCSTSIGVWIADSSNVTVTENHIDLGNSTHDGIQFATSYCTNKRPNHNHDHCTPRNGVVIADNFVAGGRTGVNIWGNGTVGLTNVRIINNTLLNSWAAGISIGSAQNILIGGNVVDVAPVPVHVSPAAENVSVTSNAFRGCATCNISYSTGAEPAKASNNTCHTMPNAVLQKLQKYFKVFYSILTCCRPLADISYGLALFKSGEGYHTFRIPALVICKTPGVILSFAEGMVRPVYVFKQLLGRMNSSADHDWNDVVMKRSTDFGKVFTNM